MSPTLYGESLLLTSEIHAVCYQYKNVECATKNGSYQKITAAKCSMQWISAHWLENQTGTSTWIVCSDHTEQEALPFQLELTLFAWIYHGTKMITTQSNQKGKIDSNAESEERKKASFSFYPPAIKEFSDWDS